MNENVPTALYRLQFNREFTFADAIRIVPYLHTLGISHIYASPLLKARAGSPHGYDIVDHNSLNPEIGDAESLHTLVEILHRHQMGLILDIVPNHMGVGGDDNMWWLDVLENGQASLYADYFDIHWKPTYSELRDKLILPFLGDHYGSVLENGELKLELDRHAGSFGIRYYEHFFPLDPRSYATVLDLCRESIKTKSEADIHAIETLDELSERFKSLPHHSDSSPESRGQRNEQSGILKNKLADYCERFPQVTEALQETVTMLNGQPGLASSFDLLHRLLEVQPYRLAYWKVAADEINYRRFFDINNLAGIRTENPHVYRITHEFIFDLLDKQRIDGLRVDHPDGLYDPFSYCDELRHRTREQKACIWIEKILASHERLSAAWPVSGTTGYDFAYYLNGLFVYPNSKGYLTRLYSNFTKLSADFDEVLYERKKLIIRSTLSSELTVLTSLLNVISEANRHTRDFTFNGLRDALTEIVACFPVYRTYVTSVRIFDEDRRYVEWAIGQAMKRNPATDRLIFDFVQKILLLEKLDSYSAEIQNRIVHFTLRFQQYTAPVMAKGMEDTAFYVFNRLLSLNDVGFDPRNFGISATSFHRSNLDRLELWPNAMLTTSTHDSKRSEDVRARMNVISELPELWRRHLGRWSRINRYRKRVADNIRIPSRNDEYAIYQILLGSWPVGTLEHKNLELYRERVEACMLKSAKEAKLHTSWINPNAEYEDSICYFIRNLLNDTSQNAFLADFVPFQKHILNFGFLNSLSQILLKLTAPGVPDIYQGNELFVFELVDPDNRRPVDFALREEQLKQLHFRCEADANLSALLNELLEQREDGRIKLYVTWKTLALRRQMKTLFRLGSYMPLPVKGEKSEHICAFARRFENSEVIVAASRWFALLNESGDAIPLGEPAWRDTYIEVPKVNSGTRYKNMFTNEIIEAGMIDGQPVLRAAEIYQTFPIALLRKEH